MNADWFDEESLEEALESGSRERRADPRRCVGELLRGIWADNTEEEARVVWRHKAALAAQWAEDCLYCLEQVILDPPPELGAFMREQGVHLHHPGDAHRSPHPYSDQDNLAWLARVAEELGAIYEAVRAENDSPDDLADDE